MFLRSGLLLLFFAGGGTADERLDSNFRRLIDVYHVLSERSAEPLNPEQSFYQGAIPGMLRTLDPHSAFLDSEQFEALQRMQASTEKGFGSVVNLLPGRVIVLQTLPGSPSARSGLSPGDEIVAINQMSLANMNIDQLVQVLSRSRQREAQLMVQRPGFTKLIPLTLVPAEMAAPSVDRFFQLDSGIGYVRAGSFEQQTAEELQKAIQETGGQELAGLVLDLRGNPGGVIEAALKVAALFLKPKQKILWIEGREGPRESVDVPDGFQTYTFPVAIVMNPQSASAAELVAGALQDHKRAVIVGETSFGKGLVQSVFELAEGTALALTTARYLTPNGRYIQRPLGSCGEFLLSPCPSPEVPRMRSWQAPSAGQSERGGILPDRVVLPRPYSRLEAVIEETNSFFEFAQNYLRNKRPEVTIDFRVEPSMLDEFQLFLSQRRIRPALAEWSASRDFIESRLLQELFNLKLGVEQGDRVEMRRDPQVQAAVRALRHKE